MKLPIFQTADQALRLMQDKWSAILNALITNPSLQSSIISQQVLINGTNVISHKLGRPLQGWRIVGINGAAQIYDKQASNQTPQLTLVLVSNAAVTVNLEVF